MKNWPKLAESSYFWAKKYLLPLEEKILAPTFDISRNFESKKEKGKKSLKFELIQETFEPKVWSFLRMFSFIYIRLFSYIKKLVGSISSKRRKLCLEGHFCRTE